ncbi:MAG: ATP-binding cassette domain-containing protein, partial [Planctomycetota bacterium]
MPTILQVFNLVKKFGDLVAVNDVSFEIQAGTCFGLLGPNGAGKTTTIELM